MHLNDYQAAALRTANRDLNGLDAKVYAVLKLTGEAGELADSLGKHIGQGHGLDNTHIIEELGDLLWHLAYAAYTWGVPLEHVARQNIAKLLRRYPDGFDEERSVHRDA